MNAHVELHVHEPFRMRIGMTWRRLIAAMCDSDSYGYRNPDCVEGSTSFRSGAIPIRARGNPGSGGRIRIRLFSRFAGGARDRECGGEEFVVAAVVGLRPPDVGSRDSHHVDLLGRNYREALPRHGDFIEADAVGGGCLRARDVDHSTGSMRDRRTSRCCSHDNVCGGKRAIFGPDDGADGSKPCNGLAYRR